MAGPKAGPSYFPDEGVALLPLPDSVPQPAPSEPKHTSPSAGQGADFVFPKRDSMLAGAVGTAVLYEDEEVRVWEN
jgi:hypothetical protein